MNPISKAVFRNLKYSGVLRKLIQKFFQIPTNKVVGDTYSKLWKFTGRVDFLFTTVTATIFGPDERSAVNNGDDKDVGYEEPLAYGSLKAFRINEAEVSMATGMINIDRDFYLSDLAIGGGLTLADPPLRTVAFSETIYPATERNFYHFVTDDLYNILKFKEKGLEFSVVYSNAGGMWKDEVLDHFVPDVARIAVGRLAKAKATILKSSKERAGYIHPEKVRYLSSHYLAGGESASPSSDIYVSRRFAPSRSYVNEYEVEQKLTSIGVEIFNPDEATFAEQVEIFRSARLIIAPHGAALCNILGMVPGASVLELRDPAHFSFCYKSIARCLGLNYSGVWLRAESGSSYLDYEALHEELVRIFSSNEYFK